MDTCIRYYVSTIVRNSSCMYIHVFFLVLRISWKWNSNARIYDLLRLLWLESGAPMPRCKRLLLWSRSGAPIRICAICRFSFGFEAVPQWCGVRFVAVGLVSKWCPCAKMYDLLLLLWPRHGAPIPMLKYMICCRCFGFGMLPQC